MAQENVEWISARRAKTCGRFTTTQLLKAAAQGQVRTLALPGEPMKFSAADVAKLRCNSSQAPHESR
jgi:hypothetical protein